MKASLDGLTRLWITSGRSNLWDCDSTYCPVPYEILPKIHNVGDDFSWLDDFSDGFFDCTLHTDENLISHLDGIQREIQLHQLDLPFEFIQFMSDSRLQAKVPTCTACYLELSDALVAFPWDEPLYALRFMNDSQGCIIWYLLMRPGGTAKVVASRYFFDPEIFEALKDDDEASEYADIFTQAYVCADSFLEFIYRFWIENSIWYSLDDERPLTNRESEYICQITKKS